MVSGKTALFKIFNDALLKTGTFLGTALAGQRPPTMLTVDGKQGRLHGIGKTLGVPLVLTITGLFSNWADFSLIG